MGWDGLGSLGWDGMGLVLIPKNSMLKLGMGSDIQKSGWDQSQIITGWGWYVGNRLKSQRICFFAIFFAAN